MTLEQAEEAVEMLNDYEHRAEVIPDYSGRGMYGTTCVAITVDSVSTLVLLGHYLAEVGVEACDLPNSVDSMGMGVVVY